MMLRYAAAIELVTWMFLVPIELARIALRRSSLAVLRERLGIGVVLGVSTKRRLLVHAVSAGEMNAASALVHEMAQRGWSIVLSAGNDDAWAIAQRIAAVHDEVEQVVRFPWDRPRAMRRWLAAIRPDAVTVLEAELWPGLFTACFAARVPLFVSGARVDRSAARRYLLARRFFARLLRGCEAVFAVDEEQAARFGAIAGGRDRIIVTGELKAEACLPDHQQASAESADVVIVAGSTHEGEELLIVKAFERVHAEVGSVRLIVAPRHVRRAKAVRALVPGVEVIDRMGELPALHRRADVILIGGTFVPVGGHDLFDAARAGRAIVVGPYVEQIRGTVAAMREANALCVTDVEGLADVLVGLVRDEHARRELGRNAQSFAKARGGAARKTADRIESVGVVKGATGPLARLCRQWETLHPYNIVEIVELTTPLDADRLVQAARETLEEMLGVRARVEVEEGFDAEAELARPFTDADAPVRIGCVSPTQVGFTFRHAFFDGAGAVLFLNRTVQRGYGHVPAAMPIAEAPTERMTVRQLLASARDLLKMRSVASRSGVRGETRANRLRFLELDPSLCARLRAEGERHGATVTDVLAARLAEGMRRIGPCGPGRRSETSIAIAVDLRRGRGPFTRDVAVAWFPVFVQDGSALGSIRRQTAREKRSHAWMRSRMEMQLASFLWPRVVEEERDRYLARQYVVSAGLTSLRFDDEPWMASYRCAVSTGPVAPLVVAAYTAGERMSLAITWRAARFRDEEIDVIAGVLCA
jgi:3-deoxy-D-manno-octulosonic-acid transferase